MHSRFLFDADFSSALLHDQAGGSFARDARSDLEKAEYDRGFQDGQAAAHAERQSVTISLLEQIAASLENIHKEGQIHLRDTEHNLIALTSELTAYFASELDPVAVITKPQFGIASIIEKAGRDSELIVMLAPEDADEIRNKFLAAKIEIAAIHESDTLSSGQFEVRWPEGGVIFDKHRLDRAYTELLEHYQKG